MPKSSRLLALMSDFRGEEQWGHGSNHTPRSGPHPRLGFDRILLCCAGYLPFKRSRRTHGAFTIRQIMLLTGLHHCVSHVQRLEYRYFGTRDVYIRGLDFRILFHEFLHNEGPFHKTQPVFKVFQQGFILGEKSNRVDFEVIVFRSLKIYGILY